MRKFDVVVLGAGAAGLMCAIEAGRRGRRTLLLDHAERVGNKILISGGGRANFTNIHTTHENFLSDNPNFARSALARFSPADMVALMETHRVPYHEKTLGQLFCDRSARDLVNLLVRECADARVTIETGTRILSLSKAPERDAAERSRFVLGTSAGTVRAASVVIATGGLSIPKLGATGLGYELARQFGLKIIEPRPALVPLTLSPGDCAAWCDLAGVSTEVIAVANAGKGKDRAAASVPAFREKMLFTHRGLSGPAILQISSYVLPGDQIRLDLAPQADVLLSELSSGPRNRVAVLTSLRAVLPGRLAERCADEALGPASGADGARTFSNAALAELEKRMHAWQFHVAGTEGFAKAEVTRGGVDTAELVAQTLEARGVPGLYFIGEVVDVTGWLGGYNFQWAWASGFCAGQSA